MVSRNYVNNHGSNGQLHATRTINRKYCPFLVLRRGVQKVLLIDFNKIPHIVSKYIPLLRITTVNISVYIFIYKLVSLLLSPDI